MHYLKFSFLIIINLWLVTSIVSQEKKTIEFIDYEVEWLQEPWVDSLSVYRQGCSLVRDLIIRDEFMITTYTNYLPAPYGFLIQRINLSDGQIDWSYNEFSEEQYTRRFVQDFKLNGDTLELYLLEESKTIYNFIYPFWDSCHVALLKLDINNGQVLESKRTDHSDPLNQVLGKSWITGSIQVISGIDNGYNVFRTEEKYKDDSIRLENFISTDLDYKGHIIKSDTVVIEFPSFYPSLGQNYPLNSDAFISHVSFRLLPSNDPEYFSSLLVLDNDLQSIDSIQLHDQFKHDSLRHIILVFNDQEKFLIETSGSFSAEEYIQKFFLFDYEGNLHTKYENSINLNERGEVFWPVAYDEDNNIIGIGEYQDVAKDTLTHLYFWKTRSATEIDTLLDLVIKDKDVNIYPRTAFITPDNDLIAFYGYQQPSFPYEIAPGFPPRWQFWIKINGEDLGLKTSATDEVNSIGSFNIFPNPVTDQLQIDFQFDSKGKIHLRDINGKLIYEVDKEPSEKTMSIDMSKLPSGIYIISHLNNDSILMGSQKVVKL